MSKLLKRSCLLLLMISCIGFALAQGAPASPANDNFQQGLVALKESRFDVALTKFTAAVSENPNDARVHNFLGIALASLGRNSQAMVEYEKAIQIDNTLEDAYRNLGFLQWNDRQLESASENLKRAVARSPQDSFAHYYLGRVLLDTQRYSQAFDELSLSQVPWPTDAGFLLEAASGYVAIGRAEDARKILGQLISVELSDAQSAHAASLLLQLRDNDAAIHVLGKVHSESSKAWVLFDLALAHLYSREYDLAESFARNCLTAALPDQAPAAWTVVGVANARLGRTEQSLEGFRRAASLSPAEEESWLNLTRELMEAGRYPEAISAVQQGLAANPKSYALHVRLGASYLAISRYTEAEMEFRNLVAAGDPLPTSYVGLAQVLLRTGRADQAATELAAAEQKLGGTFLISYFRGLALERAGKSAEAFTAFQDAITRDPNSIEAQVGLAETQLRLGKVKEAIAQLEHSRSADQKNVQIQRLLSTAYRRAGDLENATKFAQSTNAEVPSREKDLIGDFFLPSWQLPPGTSSSKH